MYAIFRSLIFRRMWANTWRLRKSEVLPRTLGNTKFNSRALKTLRLRFTIYTEKLFSHRFVQLVRKNPRSCVCSARIVHLLQQGFGKKARRVRRTRS